MPSERVDEKKQVLANAEEVLGMPTYKSLYSKLAEVTKAVGYVEKRGHNAFHGYKYVTEADLVDAVRELLAERSIVLIPSAESVVREGSVTTVHMTFTFVDGETGEKHVAGWAGTGEDPPTKSKDGKEPPMGDKGLYKAYTGAIKYFLMKSFLIPTGDDPERDDPKARQQQDNGRERGKPVNLVTSVWIDDAAKRIRKVGLTVKEVTMLLATFNAVKLGDLTEPQAALFDQQISSQAEAEQADKVAVDG